MYAIIFVTVYLDLYAPLVSLTNPLPFNEGIMYSVIYGGIIFVTFLEILTFIIRPINEQLENQEIKIKSIRKKAILILLIMLMAGQFSNQSVSVVSNQDYNLQLRPSLEAISPDNTKLALINTDITNKSVFLYLKDINKENASIFSLCNYVQGCIKAYYYIQGMKFYNDSIIFIYYNDYFDKQMMISFDIHKGEIVNEFDVLNFEYPKLFYINSSLIVGNIIYSSLNYSIAFLELVDFEKGLNLLY